MIHPKFEEIIQKIDAANGEDPNKEIFRGKEYPKELLYSIRMTDWLARLYPDASEELRLAARAQHICRWSIPRNSYPPGRVGYLKWRKDLKDFHAEKVGDILREVGYDTALIGRVQALIKKENLKSDPETQALEDVICLVFLENYFADFSKQHEEEKVVDILRKTWKKMSTVGRKAALKLPMPDTARRLVEKAVTTP